MGVGGALLFVQQSSPLSRNLELLKEPKAVQALIACNLGALILHLVAQLDLPLRCCANFPFVILAIVSTQITMRLSADDLFAQLVTNLIMPALEQRSAANSRTTELLEHLIDPIDASQGRALVSLCRNESKRMAVVIEDSSKNFGASIEDCTMKSCSSLTKSKDFLTNLVCREMFPPKKGPKQKLLHHLINFKKTPSMQDTLNCSMKVSNSCHGSQCCPAEISMKIKKMAEPDLFLLKTFRGTQNMDSMPDLRIIKPLRMNTDVVS